MCRVSIARKGAKAQRLKGSCLLSQIGGANASLLAVALTIWSGIWPVVKLVLIVLCVCDVLPVRYRDATLEWTAYLGKWSMLDVYVFLTVTTTDAATFPWLQRLTPLRFAALSSLSRSTLPAL